METILVFILGYLIGVLWERWKFFNKTGEHLQEVKKK
jgi:hypothetical protein